ncbi:Tetratricopeptide repeat-containing protein [Malonomonas rubra DSM 5091]|uniref:Tetratricopeptide repeat-containing protein n=1 Tax=Malonomonas rubra DSM 5091 TaxID=1122189 RepID=A0A1M6NU53_MALRU|nr:tetratricopeptide repeat protein [Malonomonas rubra]SHJ99259.1 Tetratricopeptide repeat-containing protein [Malonomonas rubra DSM 5091]
MGRILIIFALLLLMAGCKSTGSSNSLQQVQRNYAKYKSTSSLKNNEQAFDLILLIQQGKSSEAVAGATRALLKKPGAAWAYLVRGQAYLNSDQFELAIEDLSKAIELDPSNGESYFFRAIARSYICRSDCGTAIEDLTVAIDRGTERITIYPKGEKQTFDAYLQRSLEFRKNGQLHEALADLNYLIKRAPEASYGYLRRAQLLVLMEDFDKAFEDAKTYNALANGKGDGYTLMGIARYFQGNFAQAEKYYNSALETARRGNHKGNVIAVSFANLALVNWANGKLEQGLDLMTKAIRHQQENPDPLFYLRYGGLLHENGKTQQAAAAFSRARQLDVNSLNRLSSMESRYRHTQQMSRFFDRQMSIAKHYLENDSNALSATDVKKIEKAQSALSITSVRVNPSPVTIGQPFDIGINYIITGPSPPEKTELLFRFEILSNGKTLFTSDPINIPAKKGSNQWKQNMRPSQARGEFEVRVLLEGDGLTQSSTKMFRIQ